MQRGPAQQRIVHAPSQPPRKSARRCRSPQPIRSKIGRRPIHLTDAGPFQTVGGANTSDFRTSVIRSALAEVRKRNLLVSDDTAVANSSGRLSKWLSPDTKSKNTRAEDAGFIEMLLARQRWGIRILEICAPRGGGIVCLMKQFHRLHTSRHWGPCWFDVGAVHPAQSQTTLQILSNSPYLPTHPWRNFKSRPIGTERKAERACNMK